MYVYMCINICVMLTQNSGCRSGLVLYNVAGGDQEEDAAQHFNKGGGEQRILQRFECVNILSRLQKLQEINSKISITISIYLYV